MTAIKRLMTVVGVCAAFAVFPLTSGAITMNKCAPGPPTAASYTWNFQGEANTLFQDVRVDAQQVTTDAAQLQSFSENPNISWQLDGDKLTQVKADVDDMGRKLCRLETIRRVVAPWQRDTIDRIASNVVLMADNTQDAIEYV
ncbi:MAG: hypothetical protein WAM69_20045, partial [Candidatus Sulfotelmatobacter sp.]